MTQLPAPPKIAAITRQLKQDEGTYNSHSRLAKRTNMDGRDLPSCEDLYLGRVIAVSACQAVALLDSSHSAGHSVGDLPLEMGALVKSRTRASIV